MEVSVMSCERRPWTLHDVAYLEQQAGRVPISELAYVLQRSPEAVKQKAKKLGISLRVDSWRLGWCSGCSTWRTRADPKTGVCPVCTVRMKLQAAETEARRLCASLSGTHHFAPGSYSAEVINTPPIEPNTQRMSKAEANEAMQAYFMALEAWQLQTVQRRYDAARQRLTRIRKAIVKIS